MNDTLCICIYFYKTQSSAAQCLLVGKITEEGGWGWVVFFVVGSFLFPWDQPLANLLYFGTFMPYLQGSCRVKQIKLAEVELPNLQFK